MPELAPRPCNKMGCSNLTTNSYCPDHKQLNSGWNRHHNGKTRHERGYGNKWDKLRRRILRRDMGLCQVCAKAGRYTPAKAVDHIIPKAMNGTDEPRNLQSICNECHKAKTKTERRRSIGELLRPRNIPTPAIPVTVVCGSPGSGKSTYVSAHMGMGDIVIDLDIIKAEISGAEIHQTGSSLKLLREALHKRNVLLATLSKRTHGRCWFVTGAPRIEERKHWRDILNARIVVLETPSHIASTRMRSDGTRDGKVEMMEAWVNKWWSLYTADPFRDEVVR